MNRKRILAGSLSLLLASGSLPVWAFRVETPAMSGAEEEIARSLAGVEQLQKDVDYRLDDDNSAVFLKSVIVQQPVTLPNQVTLNPREGGLIAIGSNTTLYKGATLKGPIVIGQDVQAGGILEGSAEKPLVIGDGARIHRTEANVKESIVGPRTHINGAGVSGSTVVPFVRDGSEVPAEVGAGSFVLNGSVVFGGVVGTGIKVYDHHVVGPFVKIGNNSEHDEGFFWGVADKAPIAFPHHGYSETLWALPVAVEGAELFTPAYYDRLRQLMRAVAFGKLVKMELAEAAPVSSSGARFMATFDVDGEEVSFPAQRINFGAGLTTSDYDSSTGARASGSVMAGAAFGVYSVLKLPALVESRVLVGNLTQAEGVVGQGTLLYGAPAGNVTGPSKDRIKPVAIPGYRAPEKGFALPGGVSEEIQVQIDYFRRLAVTAGVLAEAARRATDPFTLAGHVAAVRAIHGAFGGIGPRYSKFVESVEPSLKTLKAETDPGRQARLAPRIQEQETLLQNRGGILAQINGVETAIQAAVDSVAPVTQPAIAEWVRQQVLQPETVWTNPLAAGGMEEVVPPPATVEDFAREFSELGGLQFLPREDKVRIVADLTADESDAVAALFLEPGAVAVIPTFRALERAEELTGRRADEIGVQIVALDAPDIAGDVERALTKAITTAAGGVMGRQVRLYSWRSELDLAGVIGRYAGGGTVVLQVIAPRTSRQILENLGASVQSLRSRFFELYQQAGSRWDKLFA